MGKKKHEKRDGCEEQVRAQVDAAAAPLAVKDSAPEPQDPNQEEEAMFDPIREYRLKFYLNAQHYVVFDGKRGQTHPHTWEFTLTIEVSGLETTPFTAFERGIDDCLAPYQNQVLNEHAPFDTMLPTLENLVEEFVEPFDGAVASAGGRLVALEGSEGPTRSYILRERPEARFEHEHHDLQADRARVIDDIVGHVLDD